MNKTINTIYRFFRPDDTRLKIEAVTEAYYNAETKKLTVHRKFYTFRALANFALWYVTKNPYEKAKKQLENLQNNPAYAYKLAGLTAVFLFTAILDIKNIQNITIFAGSIAYDAVSSKQDTVSPSTVSHTCTGSDRVLVTVVAIAGTQTATAKYNNVSMTESATENSNSERMYIFTLANPNTGANNIELTLSANQDVTFGGISFSGAHTTSPVGATNSNTGSGVSSINTNITTQYDNSIVVDMVGWLNTWGAGQTVDVQDAGQTRRFRYGSSSSSPIGGVGASTETTTTAGTKNLGWTRSGGSGYVHHILLEVREKLTAQNYTKDLTETITLVELLVKKPGKAVTEVITLSEVFARLATRFRSFTEVITLVEVVTPIKSVFRTLTETIDLLEVQAKKTVKSFIETLSLNEVFSTAKTYARVFTETITLVESILVGIFYSRVLTETISLQDTAKKTTSKIFIETLNIIERFLGLFNGKDISYHSKYEDRPGTYTNKYEDRPGTYIKKYLDF